jgi:hypothetical protein
VGKESFVGTLSSCSFARTTSSLPMNAPQVDTSFFEGIAALAPQSDSLDGPEHVDLAVADAMDDIYRVQLDAVIICHNEPAEVVARATRILWRSAAWQDEAPGFTFPHSPQAALYYRGNVLLLQGQAHAALMNAVEARRCYEAVRTIARIAAKSAHTEREQRVCNAFDYSADTGVHAVQLAERASETGGPLPGTPPCHFGRL